MTSGTATATRSNDPTPVGRNVVSRSGPHETVAAQLRVRGPFERVDGPVVPPHRVHPAATEVGDQVRGRVHRVHDLRGCDPIAALGQGRSGARTDHDEVHHHQRDEQCGDDRTRGPLEIDRCGRAGRDQHHQPGPPADGIAGIDLQRHHTQDRQAEQREHRHQEQDPGRPSPPHERDHAGHGDDRQRERPDQRADLDRTSHRHLVAAREDTPRGAQHPDQALWVAPLGVLDAGPGAGIERRHPVAQVPDEQGAHPHHDAARGGGDPTDHPGPTGARRQAEDDGDGGSVHRLRVHRRARQHAGDEPPPQMPLGARVATATRTASPPSRAPSW